MLITSPVPEDELLQSILSGNEETGLLDILAPYNPTDDDLFVLELLEGELWQINSTIKQEKSTKLTITLMDIR